MAGDPEVLGTLGFTSGSSLRRWVRRGIGLGLLLGVATGLGVWKVRRNPTPRPAYATARVELGDVVETVTATGTLSPLDAVDVGAEVSGRVLAVHADVNDRVEAGQALVEIDPEQLAAKVDEAEAQVRSANAALASARASLEESDLRARRTRDLQRSGLASAQDLEAAEAALARAGAQISTNRAQVALARASTKSARASRAKAVVRSPLAGIVLARSVEPGQTVTVGFQTPVLFTVAREISRMQLSIDVDEADVVKVRSGQSATFVVDAYPTREFTASVVRVSNLPKRGAAVVTYEALLSVENPEQLLRPGMTATTIIVTSRADNVLTVPPAALRFRPDDRTGTTASGVALPGFGRMPPPPGADIGPGGGGPNPAALGAASRPPAATRRPASATLFVIRNGRLDRIAVERGVSDGKRVQVASADLAPGVEVVTDVVEVEK